MPTLQEEALKPAPQGLDPDVVNLAKAIRYKETRNIQKPGQTGELSSRYQFTPPTWANGAKKYLGDANAPLTLENENKVAYSQIKAWKDAGYNAGEIASLWNSGNPNMYAKGDKGVGKSSVNPKVTFNVPEYVKGVYSAYQSIKNLQTQQQSYQAKGITDEELQKQSQPGFVASVAQDIGETVAKPIVSGIRAGQGLLALGGLAGRTLTGDPRAKQKFIQEGQVDKPINVPVLGEVEPVSTPQESIAAGLKAGLLMQAGTGSAAQGLARQAVSRLSVGTLSQFPRVLPTVEKALTVGKGVIPRAIEQGLLGLGYNVGTNIEQGKPITENAGTAFGAGALFPVGGTGLAAVKSKVVTPAKEGVATRLVNSLIKPLLRDFSYGKNPGRGIAREGITGNTLDELATNITSARQKVGQQKQALLSQARYQNKSVNLTDITRPLDEAMQQAAKGGETNRGLIQRLQEHKDAILNEYEIVNGVAQRTGARQLAYLPVQVADKVKQLIGTMTKWTGNFSDDAVINKALKQSYGIAKGKIEQVVPEVKALNERWGDLMSAEIATKYRDKIQQRQAIINFSNKILGIGGLLGGAIVSGGAVLPAILAGASGAILDKIFSSPRVKTNLAAWLAKSSATERASIIEGIPVLRGIFSRIFGENEKLPIQEIKQGLDDIKLLMEPTMRLPAQTESARQQAIRSSGILPQTPIYPAPSTGRFSLPAPRSIPMGAKTPSPSSVKGIPAKKGLIGRNPKTGKFFGTYKSN